MLKIAVVDDDRLIIDKICNLINKCIKQEKEIITYINSTDFFNSSEKFSYDIVFLDIDMPEINGFAIAGDLKIIKPEMSIVFISNLENFIIDSIRFRPVAFIRKTHMEHDFSNNIDLLQKCSSGTSSVFYVEIEGVDVAVSLNDIMFFESVGHELFVSTMYNNYSKKRGRNNNMTLKMLSEKYSSEGFILVSRNYLINYRYIDVINRNNIILKDKKKIKISSRNSTEIRLIYQKFIMMGGVPCLLK